MSQTYTNLRELLDSEKINRESTLRELQWFLTGGGVPPSYSEEHLEIIGRGGAFLVMTMTEYATST